MNKYKYVCRSENAYIWQQENKKDAFRLFIAI